MFDFYSTINGVDWYKCRCCQYKTRGKPKVCPICGDTQPETKGTNINAEAKIDKAISQFEELFKKYGGKP